ncbi:FprA family A-type flavoprotein [Cereibacter sphaeroides]|uniref:FprA family A-type flavoprotein n=1 Tax=Cereibacter sphaeroides TaxID=1063 RepID=UPI000F52772A|nr:FprA family A-type flavoprotein [Cereibacter sphaeroides]AZB65940.1 FprA family A-type flavoprotein [Cereibacter sphaeroides]AZB70700.1 FprA family A-type flavoprotein [Cereibacter sphaeroides]
MTAAAARPASVPPLPAEGPVEIVPGVHWIGAFDPGLRSFDTLMKTANGTSYNAYTVRGAAGVAVIDTVHADHADTFFARLEAVARYDEITQIVLNHLEPDHSGALPELLRRAPQAEIRLSPRGLPILRALLRDAFETARILPVTTGAETDLGGRRLRFLTTPNVHWPDTQCTYLVEDGILFTCDLLGSHYCDERLFDDLVGDFRFAMDHYFDRLMRPFRSFVTQALDLIEPLELSVIAPSHGPVLRTDPRAYLRQYRRLAGPRSAPGPDRTLAILYISAHGATARLAQAIRDGAAGEPGVRVSLFDLEGGELHPFLDLIEEVDGIALGTPTINGDAVRAIWELLAMLVDIETRGKLGAAFGSYGWSGEAVRQVEARLQGLKMRLPEPGLKVKLEPTDEDLQEARAFGRRLAAHLTGRAPPREVDLADLASR